MSGRMIRINELIKREVSQLIHTFYQAESVYITITRVEISPDLRQGSVFYSVIGDALKQRQARQFFDRYKKDIRFKVSKKVTLKYLPLLHYIPDDSTEKTVEFIDHMQEIEAEDQNQ